MISALVEEFLVEKDQITGEDLGRLEKEVMTALKAKRRHYTPSSAIQYSNDDSASSKAAEEAPVTKPGSSSSSSLVPPPPGSEWSVIAAYQELMQEEKAKEEQLAARLKKLKFKQSLDDHIAKAKVLRAQTEDKSDMEYSAHVNRDVKVFYEQEKIKKDAIHKKHHDELMQRKQQILDKMEAAKQAKLQQLEGEYRDLALAAEKIEQEKEKQRDIRRRAMDNQAIVDKDNKENERLRELKRIADAKEDERLMKEYAAKMDAEEEARASAFKKRMDEMAKFAEKFENEGAGKSAKEERIKMEQLLLLEQQRKEESDAAKEAKKQSDRRARLQLQMEENTRLLERKKAKEDQLKREDLDYQAYVLRDVDKFKKLEEQKKVVRKIQTSKYRVILDEQAKNKVIDADPKSAAFVGREGDINRGLLEKAIHDPKVLQRINAEKGGVSSIVAGGKSVVSQPMKIAVNK